MELVPVPFQTWQCEGLGHLHANAGFTRSTTPRIGDIAVWTSGRYGHVGVVVTVNPTVIEDYNKAGTGSDALRVDNTANYYLHR